ncbi:MAG: cold shock domain-containing protein [Armatimonadota bacterium]|nr:cold shock domain-containing protein [Armatimonadota bacterium]
MEGKVKSFSRNSGFGFITTATGEDVFVHHTDLIDEGREYLLPGQGVQFEVVRTDRGPRAAKVRVTQEVPLAKERRLDWRGRRHGHPRAGQVPKAALRARGLLAEEEEKEESPPEKEKE